MCSALLDPFKSPSFLGGPRTKLFHRLMTQSTCHPLLESLETQNHRTRMVRRGWGSVEQQAYYVCVCSVGGAEGSWQEDSGDVGFRPTGKLRENRWGCTKGIMVLVAHSRILSMDISSLQGLQQRCALRMSAEAKSTRQRYGELQWHERSWLLEDVSSEEVFPAAPVRPQSAEEGKAWPWPPKLLGWRVHSSLYDFYIFWRSCLEKVRSPHVSLCH